MYVDSVDTLLAVLRRADIFGPEQILEITRELLPHYSSADDLGRYLVEIDWLTPYQLQLLLGGRWDELTIGPYQILDQLGEGGVSEVLKAWDTVHGRVVALKVLRQHLAVNNRMVTQFQREMQAIKALSHPNIIKTYEANQVGTIHYFAMEFIEGADLERHVRDAGPLAVTRACDYIRQVANGLQHAHQLALVHRDIKPANLFVPNPLPGPDGRRGPDLPVKIIDWGLARCSRPGEGSKGVRPMTDSANGIEKISLLGTADYLAPEQALDPTLVDVRADIYSLGCTLFYLLTGRPPFPAPSLMQKIMMHREADPPSLKDIREDVPEELDGIVRKMLAKAPEDRFQIPLLVVAPLRRFCGSGISSLPRIGGTAPGTSINLPRPETATALPRPPSNNGTGNQPRH